MFNNTIIVCKNKLDLFSEALSLMKSYLPNNQPTHDFKFV